MKALFKVCFAFITIFFMIFLFIKFTGILTVDQIKTLLMDMKSLSPWYMGLVVVFLLCIDLFIAVPTLTVIMLSGYFLGFLYGALFSITGLLLAGSIGYILSLRYGTTLLHFLVKEEEKREELCELFHRHGFIMIILSRALPMFPETSVCLSGMVKMKFVWFFLAWVLSSVPYALILSYSGSISTIDNPQPAIITIIGLFTIFSLIWLGYQRYYKRHSSKYI